jgi:effector-binding domain-containing protein
VVTVQPERSIMIKPTSRLRHSTKIGLVKLCQEKEQAGWTCIKPIQAVTTSNKNFKRRGSYFEYEYTDNKFYYEAYYRLGGGFKQCSKTRQRLI